MWPLKNMLFFLIIASSSHVTFSKETITMGFFNLPPFQYKDTHTKNPKGYFITNFEEAALKMGYQVKWLGPLPLPRLGDYLKDGREIDGAVGFPKLAEFEPYMYFSKEPVLIGKPTLFVIHDSPLLKLKTINEIRGYRIGTFKSISNTYSPLIDKNRDALTLEEIGTDSWIEQNLMKLKSGRIDAIYDRQEYSVPFVAQQTKNNIILRSVSIPDPPSLLYIVFSKNTKNGKMLIEKYNHTNQRTKKQTSIN